MSGVGMIGIGLHIMLLMWIAPIAFFDNGTLATDWTETLIPFAALGAPLLLAGKRSANGFGLASLLGFTLASIFLLGPGLLLVVPALCYACAAVQEASRRDQPKSV